MFRILLICLFLFTARFAGAQATLTDLWGDPREPGWGVSIIQQEDVAFVLLFVHGPDREPQWYVASNAQAVAYSADGLPSLRGTLYRSRGPWLGGAFDPAAVDATPVGDLTVDPVNSSKVIVSYRVAGTSVSKTVERHTWRIAAPPSPFQGQFIVTRIENGLPERIFYSGMTTFDISGSAGSMIVDDGQTRCEYRGAYEQAGRLGFLMGPFSCSNGRAGSFRVTDLEFTAQGFSGRLQANWAGGSLTGRFGGPRR